MTWEIIDENTDYEVSRQGRVRHIKSNKIINEYITCDGHSYVYLKNPEKYVLRNVHVLVAKAFVKRNKPEERFVDHIDRNPRNNNAENLRWVTRYVNNCNRGCWSNKKCGVIYDLIMDEWFAYRMTNNLREIKSFDKDNKEYACLWAFRREYINKIKKIQKKLDDYAKFGKPKNKYYANDKKIWLIKKEFLTNQINLKLISNINEKDNKNSDSDDEPNNKKNNISKSSQEYSSESSDDDNSNIKQKYAKHGKYFVDNSKCDNVNLKYNKKLLNKVAVKKKSETDSDSDEKESDSDEIKPVNKKPQKKSKTDSDSDKKESDSDEKLIKKKSKTNKKSDSDGNKNVKKNSKTIKYVSCLNMTIAKGKNTYFVNTAKC
jgi:hypothetical protein